VPPHATIAELKMMASTGSSRAEKHRIRVMQVIGSLHIGGAERVVAHLAHGLDPDSFETIVCCTRGIGTVGERLRDSGVDVRLVRPRRVFRHFTSLSLAREIASFRPDILHSHGASALIHTGPAAAMRRRCPWVHTFHFGNYPKPAGTQASAERFFARYPTQLIAVSHRQRESIVEALGVAPERLDVLVNGVAPTSWSDDEGARLRRRTECGFREQDVVVGTVAVLSEQKGVSYLLQAAKQVVQELPSARFLIVGGGPLEAQLKSEASALGLDGAILFTGWREDALELLPVLDVFVMASLWEAMPMVLLEAMSAQRPVIVTDVGDNARVVGGGECGVIVPPKDPESLRRAILGLASDRARAMALGIRARARFDDHFTVSRMVSEHASLYRRLRTGDIAGAGFAVNETPSA
jgi:glycosyltransferase involved in cell wall biosynthesis